MEPQKTIGLLNLWFAVERKHLDDNAYLPVSGNGVKDEALACYAGGLGEIPVVPHVVGTNKRNRTLFWHNMTWPKIATIIYES